jgi:hypothetical protein
LEVVRVGVGIGDSWVGTLGIATTNNMIYSKLNDIINTIRKKQKPDTNNLIPGTNYKKVHSLRYKHCM